MAMSAKNLDIIRIASEFLVSFPRHLVMSMQSLCTSAFLTFSAFFLDSANHNFGLMSSFGMPSFPKGMVGAAQLPSPSLGHARNGAIFIGSSATQAGCESFFTFDAFVFKNLLEFPELNFFRTFARTAMRRISNMTIRPLKSLFTNWTFKNRMPPHSNFTFGHTYAW